MLLFSFELRSLPLFCCVVLSDLGAPVRCVGVRLLLRCWTAAALMCPRHAEIEVKGEVSSVISPHSIGEGEGFSHVLSPLSFVHHHLSMCCLGDEAEASRVI